MRNNEDRLGAINTAAAATPPIQQQQAQPQQQPEQTFQFVTPTEFVEIPSKGRFYPEGHPLHNVETIEIRHMTAKDEDILTSTALLKKGLAIDRFLQNIVVDKRISISDLLVGDKNAIIVASRISGYGQVYQASVGCPSCSTTVDFEFDLSECKAIPHDNHEQYGVRLTENNTFIIHVEKMNLDVEVRLMTSRDESALVRFSEKKRKKKLPESNLTDQLRAIIVSVGGNPDRGYIESFIQHLPARDSRKLRTTYQKIIPNLDMDQNFICSVCEYDGEVSVPFGANFFWPKQ